MEANICFKCMTDAGPDAVLLRNGTYLCPTCYQRMYPAKQDPPKAKAVHISVEGVIAIVAVVGLFVIGYLIFQHVVASQKAEAIAVLKAQQVAEQHLREEAEAQEVIRKQIEKERQEAIAKSEQEKERRVQAAKAADLEREAKRAADLAAREQRRRDDERKSAEARERDRLFEEARLAKEAADAGRTRGGEIASLVKTIMDSQKTILGVSGGKTDLLRRAAASKQTMHSNEQIRDGLLNRYRLEQHLPPTTHVSDPTQWRQGPATKSTTVGQSAVTVEVESEYPKLAAKFDKVTEEIKQADEKLQAVNADIAKIESAEAELLPKIADAKARLTELNATPAEIAAAGGNNSLLQTGTTLRTILLKNGTQLKAQSIINAGDTTMYKDENGKTQTIKAADVERIQ